MNGLRTCSKPANLCATNSSQGRWRRLPAWVELPVAVILLDYSIYWWHVLMHRVPFLWRFHLVHHVDLDMDASTAFRFHFGELVLSVPWRTGQIVLLGIAPLSFSVWQTDFVLCILFYHSEVKLPISVERWLNRFLVTPRMHGIHHSIIEAETNSDGSSGLTLWDMLHGTLRLNVPQRAIVIGVPAYQEPHGVTLQKVIQLPLREPWPPMAPCQPAKLPTRFHIISAIAATAPAKRRSIPHHFAHRCDDSHMPGATSSQRPSRDGYRIATSA